MTTIELLSELYTDLLLLVTFAVELVTGLYPHEQLTYLQQMFDLPATTGFSGVLSAALS